MRVNQFNLKRDFDNFVNKLRHMATRQNDENQKNADQQLDSSTSGIGNPPPIQPHINYRKEKTNINSLETFRQLVENIFKPANYKRIKNNINNIRKKSSEGHTK